MSLEIDLTGEVYESWTFLERRQKNYWLCQCVCGKQKVVQSSAIKSGRSKSCGCQVWSKEREKHGMYGTREYRSYNSMKGRCLNPNNERYHSHGGRGIKICDSWLNSFEAFYLDMGPRPPNTSLERKNNDGDYTPDNCIWATPKEQASNTKQAKHYTINGITDTQAGWARRMTMTPQLLSKRLAKGMSIEQALGLAS